VRTKIGALRNKRPIERIESRQTSTLTQQINDRLEAAAAFHLGIDFDACLAIGIDQCLRIAVGEIRPFHTGVQLDQSIDAAHALLIGRRRLPVQIFAHGVDRASQFAGNGTKALALLVQYLDLHVPLA
jgi:hypothetical protein